MERGAKARRPLRQAQGDLVATTAGSSKTSILLLLSVVLALFVALFALLLSILLSIGSSIEKSLQEARRFGGSRCRCWS